MMEALTVQKRALFVAWIGILLGAAFPTVSARAQTVTWFRQFGTSAFDEVFEVAVDATGVYAVGRTGDALPGQTNQGGFDAFVRKFDASGTELWTRQFGDDAYGVVTDGASIYVVGDTDLLPGQTGFGGRDAFIRKYDTAGNEIWTRQFGTGGPDSALAVAVSGSDVYVVGSALGAFPGQSHAGGLDGFVRKYDDAGNALWTRQFGTSGHDQPVGVAASPTAVYVSGSVRGALPGQTFGGIDDAFVRQYRADGDEGWTRQFGLGGIDSATAVALNGDNLYVVGTDSRLNMAGTSVITVIFVRQHDPDDGVQRWERTFSGTETLTAAFADSAGVHVAGLTAGTLPGQTRAGGEDAFARRYDSSGTEVWTKQFGSSVNETGAGVVADANAVYVGGRTNGTLSSQTSAGDFDAYLVRLTVAPQPVPVVPAGGVVNNGSYAASPAPVAPGSIAAVFGINLNGGASVLSSNFGPDGKLLTTLGGTSVTLSGVAAPMFYSTPGQVGIQIPFELAGQTSATILVTTGGQTSAPQTVFLDAFAPGIFTVNQGGTGLAAVLHQNGITPVTPQNPAHPGEVLVFFGTGFGVVSPPLVTGARSNGNTTATPATATVDGVAAAVQFSGTAPGFVGLNQLNVLIPPNTRIAPNIPVVFTIGGKQSNTVTIPVSP